MSKLSETNKQSMTKQKRISNRNKVKKNEVPEKEKGLAVKSEILTLPPPQGWASRPTVRSIRFSILEDGTEMMRGNIEKTRGTWVLLIECSNSFIS